MIADFFIWCAGARTKVLTECPTERVKIIGMGMAVFFVALLSVVSATFFITYAFGKKDVNDIGFTIRMPYVCAGILWGLIIFTIDRNIIVSIKKTGNVKEELKKGSPRIVLAVFIGIVISTPLELKFFEKEINQQVEAEIQKKALQDNAEKVGPLISQDDALVRQIEQYGSLKESAFNNALNETNGKGITGIRSYGPKAKEWEAKASQYGKLADSLTALELVLKNQITEAQKGLTIEDLRNGGIIDHYDGAEARINALYHLGFFHWVITFLFVMLEVLPLLVKLMMPRGPYDEVLERMEYEVFIDQKRIISNKNSEINSLLQQINDLNTLRHTQTIRIQQSKLDAELAANDALLRDVAEKQAGLARIAIKKWYSEELAKLKSQPVNGQPSVKSTVQQGVKITLPELEEETPLP